MKIAKVENSLGYEIRFTKMANASFTEKYKLRIIDVFKYYPELNSEIVCVGWITPRGWARGSAISSCDVNKTLKISLQPNEKNFTIAHEFTHLLQAKKKEGELKIPSGERPCDVWTLARLPLELLDDFPSYITMSYQARKQWHDIKAKVRELALQAIELRKTKRRYIEWLEDEIRSIKILKK
jgi:hypothetical protein